MKIKSVLLAVLIVVSTITVQTMAADNEINILVNNQPVQSEVKPVVVENTVFVPIRPVAEAMGCEVIWVASMQSVNIRNKTTIIGMQVGNDKISRQKRTSEGATTVLTCEKAPRVINGSAYIPLRSMAEALGAQVAWDQTGKTVIIVYDTTVKYAGNKTISTFAGNGIKQRYDGTIDKMQFMSPESIDIANDGSIYISDSGAIRKISNGKSETVEFEPSYITSAIVRCFGNDVYFTTNAFEDTDGVQYYGIVKLSNGVAEGIFITEAVYSRVSDFQIDSKGNIYMIFANMGTGTTYLGKLDISSGNVNYIKSIDDGFSCLAIDDEDNIYIGNAVKGSIYYYNVAEDKLKLCAGVDENTRFVDGPNPMFFEPRAMEYSDGYLYVVDYNLIRQISVNNGVAITCETIAGKVSADTDPKITNGKASESALTPSYLMDILVNNNKVYFTDPKNAMIRLVE